MGASVVAARPASPAGPRGSPAPAPSMPPSFDGALFTLPSASTPTTNARGQTNLGARWRETGPSDLALDPHAEDQPLMGRLLSPRSSSGERSGLGGGWAAVGLTVGPAGGATVGG